MSKKKSKALEDFLKRDGYLLVFTLISAITLVSYFLANKSFTTNLEREVLGSTALRGVWVDAGMGIECPEMRGLDVEGCIEDSYFEDFSQIESETVHFEDDGRIVYSNDEMFVSGIFDVSRSLDNDVWKDVYIGDLNLKINSRQWVFEDVVWNRAESPLVDVVPSDKGYFVIFYPSITLTSRTKQFWVYEYVLEDDIVRSLSFIDSDGDRAFIESSIFSILEYEGDLFFRFDRLDPSLMRNREVRLYRYDGDLELFRSFLLLRE